MSQMIALGQTVIVNYAHCGRHAWHVSVMPGTQKMVCPLCHHPTKTTFFIDDDAGGRTLFSMDVNLRE